MKKLSLFLFLILVAAFAACSTPVTNSRNTVGTVIDCTTDTDVDAAFSTTVAVDAAADQKVIGLTAVTNLVAGDTILIDADNSGPRKEVCVVASIASLDVTCVDDLTYAHTAAQADDVVLTNRIGPLNPGESYHVQIVTTSGAPQAGRFIQGDEYVDAETNGGIYDASGVGPSGKTVRATSKYSYISFKAFTGNAIGSACQVR